MPSLFGKAPKGFWRQFEQQLKLNGIGDLLGKVQIKRGPFGPFLVNRKTMKVTGPLPTELYLPGLVIKDATENC
jgi:hypothetical protein